MADTKKLKVLVIRFSSIGDIVLCSPVLRCLKQIPGKPVETHFLTKRSFASFVRNYPYIDKVYSLQDSLPEVIGGLKKENYDFVIDLHNNLRSMRVKMALGKPSKAFHKLNAQKWLLTNLKIDRMPEMHIVDRYMLTAQQLGIENDKQGLDFFIPDGEKVDPGQLPENFRNGFVGFVIGGTYATKRLPVHKMVSLCNQLHKPVVLLGGPEDRDTADEIVSKSKTEVFNACGKFSLNGSASLVEQAQVVVSHDTGLMHIAAAFNKPLASVWGNTVPQLGMYPYFPGKGQKPVSKIFEINNLRCRPCSKIGYSKCPKKHFKCMEDISQDAIARWVNDVLKSLR